MSKAEQLQDPEPYARLDADECNVKKIIDLSPKPAISVIIPTYQREESLLRCLRRLSACAGREKVEVVVVDQTPREEWQPVDDDVVGTFHSFSRVFSPFPNLPAARNRGARLSISPLLLFLDDDVEVESSYIKMLLSILHQRTLDVVGGNCLRTLKRDSMPTSDFELAEWLEGINTALRREDFINVGGYDENLFNNEDAEFCHRLRLSGLRLGKHKDLRLIHHIEPTGGTRYHRFLFRSARKMIQSDLYFTRAIGGNLWRILWCAIATTRREARGHRLKTGTASTRLLACAIAVPAALLYAFRKPRLFRPH